MNNSNGSRQENERRMPGTGWSIEEVDASQVAWREHMLRRCGPKPTVFSLISAKHYLFELDQNGRRPPHSYGSW